MGRASAASRAKTQTGQNRRVWRATARLPIQPMQLFLSLERLRNGEEIKGAIEMAVGIILFCWVAIGITIARRRDDGFLN
jgi:hypothetical protein